MILRAGKLEPLAPHHVLLLAAENARWQEEALRLTLERRVNTFRDGSGVRIQYGPAVVGRGR